MAQKIRYEIEVDTSNAEDSINDLNEDLEDLNEEATEGTKKMGEAIEGVGGPLARARGGVQALSAGFKALLANPVVLVLSAIVGALAGLYKAFTSTKEGAERMNAIFAGVRATLDVLRDRVLKAAQAFRLLFQGKLKEAADQFKESVSGITDEIREEAKAAAETSRALDRLADAERNLTVERAKQNKIIAQAKLDSVDQNRSLEERLELIQKAGDLEVDLANKELAVARQRVAAIQERNSLSDSSVEDLQEEADAIARVYELETASLALREELAGRVKAFQDEQKAKADEARAAAEEQRKAEEEAAQAKLDEERELAETLINEKADRERIEALNTITNQEELSARLLEIEDARNNELIAMREKYQESTTDLELKAAEQTAALRAQQAAEQAAKDAEDLADQQELAAKKIETENMMYSAIQSLASADTAWGKAIAVSSAVIDTYKGATKALGQGGALGFAAAAAVTAAGLANIRNILAQDPADPPIGSAGGGAAVSLPSFGPSVGITGANLGNNAQINESLGSLLDRPAEAYVVGQKVSTQQSLDRHITRNATVGG